MLVLLHGAKRNVGDFLIFERARELIREVRQTDDFIELPRWSSLNSHLELINKSEAVILCGGPGYGKNFYPDIFPLTSNLDDIKVPIVPLGLGWGVGNTSETVGEFKFTSQSLQAIQRIHSCISYSSTRDVLTEQILKNNDIKNVTTTGCPAWFYLPYIDKEFVPPKQLNKIVVSTPAQRESFNQASQLISLLKKILPGAEIYLVFHRGIYPGAHTLFREIVLNLSLAVKEFLRNCKIVDASYSTRKIDFYKDCDLHIGYRVHAHLDFLSYRKPSILIQEDARGVGQSMTLQTIDFLSTDENMFRKLQNTLENHIETRFIAFSSTIAIMKQKYEVMKEFLQSF